MSERITLRTGTRRATIVLAAAAALLTAAFAAAPAADAATIYACVKKSSGSARFVSQQAKCKKNEFKLSWNSRGSNGRNGAQGAPGSKGANGSPGAQGTAGKEGKEGAAGSALAFAHVSAAGVVDPERSKNVTTANIESIGAGAWCFHGLPFTPKNVVASLTNFTLGFITVGVPPDTGVCPAGTQARVQTWNDAATPVITNEAFEVLFN